MLRTIPVPFGMAAAGAALLASSPPLAETLAASSPTLAIAAFGAGAVLFASGLSMVAVEVVDRALGDRRGDSSPRSRPRRGRRCAQRA
jgi:hypothetical protein